MQNVKEKNLDFMRHAITLARRGLGRCAPNPSVGCVIVKNGRIIGRGRTGDGGRPHAETVALAAAGDDANGADVYVTLEPCAHTGHTPPCAQALITAGVRRVYIAATDPDPRTCGKGIAMLRAAGIDVIDTVCTSEGARVNSGFFTRMTKNRPHVTLKIATSLDGKIALGSGDSQWITGNAARAHVHSVRSKHDALLTGIGTAIADDPQMTARVRGYNHTIIRVVLDSDLRVPKHAALRQDTTTHPLLILHNANLGDHVKSGDIVASDIQYIKIQKNNGGTLDLNAALTALADRGITRLMVEGGAGVFTSFIRARLWDDLYWYRAPKIIGGDGIGAISALGVNDMDDVAALTPHTSIRLGGDVLDVYTK